MDSSIIFEKKYSQFIQECCDNVPAPGREGSDKSVAGNDPTDYVRKLLAESVCVLMPERMEERNYFFDLAKEIAEAYLIDIVIKERNNRITVTYTLDCDAGFTCLKPIIQLADELTFRNVKNGVLISLDFYTHATYRSGIKVFP